MLLFHRSPGSVLTPLLFMDWVMFMVSMCLYPPKTGENFSVLFFSSFTSHLGCYCCWEAVWPAWNGAWVQAVMLHSYKRYHSCRRWLLACPVKLTKRWPLYPIQPILLYSMLITSVDFNMDCNGFFSHPHCLRDRNGSTELDTGSCSIKAWIVSSNWVALAPVLSIAWVVVAVILFWKRGATEPIWGHPSPCYICHLVPGLRALVASERTELPEGL